MKLIYTLFLILSLSTILSASSREGKMEFFFTPIYVNSNTVNFDGGSQLDLNSRSGFGFGFGYNIDEHIELSMLFNSSSSSYKATVVRDDGSKKNYVSNMYTTSANFAATYNFIDGPLTPYITGTFGYTYIDSGIASGISSGCYWDPWLGYICGPVVSTYNSNELNYGASVGLRYDVNKKIYFKLGVGKSWLDLSNASSNDFTVYDLTLGMKF